MTTIPSKIELKKTEGLTIVWSDGKRSEYTLAYLRGQCPCATCRTLREQAGPHVEKSETGKKVSLLVMPADYRPEATVVNAEMVGNYAMRLTWSDNHDSGIYSFRYLREIAH